MEMNELPIDDPARPERSLTPAKILAAVQVPDKGRPIYWVRGVGMPTGLGLQVRPPTARHSFNASWIVQSDDPLGKSRRLTIARFGELRIPDVLLKAVELRKQIMDGTHAERKQETRATALRNSFTVGLMFQLWLEHLQQHARPSTIKNAIGNGTAEDITAGTLKSGYVKCHFGDWLSRPLASITREMLRDRHAKITKRSPSNANRVMKSMRAAWNRALELHDLPPNLLSKFTWNKEKVGGKAIHMHELPDWWARVHKLPWVRKEWNLFALLTAARRDDVKTLRWEHVDLDLGTVHFPNPKGGETRAYTIPICRFLIDMLRKREESNGWVFPSRGGHIGQPAEHRMIDGKKRRVLPSPHMLRRTWITVADDLITEKQCNLLTNHGDNKSKVGLRYKVLEMDKIREATEKVAAFLLDKVGVEVVKRDAG